MLFALHGATPRSGCCAHHAEIHSLLVLGSAVPVVGAALEDMDGPEDDVETLAEMGKGKEDENGANITMSV